MTAAAIISEGAKHGLSLSAKQIYKIRAKAKKSLTAPKRKPGRPKKSAAAKAVGGSSSSMSSSTPKASASKASVPKASASKGSAPKAATLKRASGSINKSAYVRGLPSTLSAAEVVKRGAAANIKLNVGQVYTIRANQRKAAKKGPSVRKPGRPSNASKGTKVVAHKAPAGKTSSRGASRGSSAASPSVAKVAPRHAGDSSTFVAMALDIGLAKAEALIKSVRSHLTKI